MSGNTKQVIQTVVSFGTALLGAFSDGLSLIEAKYSDQEVVDIADLEQSLARVLMLAHANWEQDLLDKAVPPHGLS